MQGSLCQSPLSPNGDNFMKMAIKMKNWRYKMAIILSFLNKKYKFRYSKKSFNLDKFTRVIYSFINARRYFRNGEMWWAVGMVEQGATHRQVGEAHGVHHTVVTGPGRGFFSMVHHLGDMLVAEKGQ